MDDLFQDLLDDYGAALHGLHCVQAENALATDPGTRAEQQQRARTADQALGEALHNLRQHSIQIARQSAEQNAQQPDLDLEGGDLLTEVIESVVGLDTLSDAGEAEAQENDDADALDAEPEPEPQS